MMFAHDTRGALVAAVALVNSVDAVGMDETLHSCAGLAAFLVEHGYTGRHDGDRPELDQVCALVPSLRELLLAERDEAADLVNRALAGVRLAPQLRRHGEVDWHLHVIEDDRPLAQRILVETAMAMVEVIRADETSRLGVCADPTCRGVVLDLSRNRSKRFCSTACGNRQAVAAYRARRA